MTRLTAGLAMGVALLAGGLVAAPAYGEKAAVDLPGALKVVDDAKLFSDDAVRQADRRMSGTKFDHGLHLTVDTYPAIPADRKAKYDPSRKAKFFEDWARSVATGDKARGPYVLICMDPGYTEVIVDEQTLNRGFSSADAGELRRIFDTAMRESAHKPAAEQKAIRDKALVDATDFVVKDLTGTKVVRADGAPVSAPGKPAPAARQGGLSVGNWVCIGLCVLLGVWLVIGLIRAFTGGGGGGGYGGGGGGGGFGSSLLGGLFGAMAGMWLYNSMFGSGGMFGGGSDAYAGDGGAGGSADTGAGDYGDGTSSGGGGDYGGGDTGGGGDYGGGGGDYGGGGDFGGGGDYGGGGDF